MGTRVPSTDSAKTCSVTKSAAARCDVDGRTIVVRSVSTLCDHSEPDSANDTTW